MNHDLKEFNEYFKELERKVSFKRSISVLIEIIK